MAENGEAVRYGGGTKFVLGVYGCAGAAICTAFGSIFGSVGAIGGLMSFVGLALFVFGLGRIPGVFTLECPICRYDLTGLSGSVCPECGRSAAAGAVLGRRRRRWKTVLLGLVLMWPLWWLLVQFGLIVVVPNGPPRWVVAIGVRLGFDSAAEEFCRGLSGRWSNGLTPKEREAIVDVILKVWSRPGFRLRHERECLEFLANWYVTDKRVVRMLKDHPPTPQGVRVFVDGAYMQQGGQTDPCDYAAAVVADVTVPTSVRSMYLQAMDRTRCVREASHKRALEAAAQDPDPLLRDFVPERQLWRR